MLNNVKTVTLTQTMGPICAKEGSNYISNEGFGTQRMQDRNQYIIKDKMVRR